MSPRATVPLTSDIAAGLAMFFHKGPWTQSCRSEQSPTRRRVVRRRLHV